MNNLLRLQKSKGKKYYIIYFFFILTFILLITTFVYCNNVYNLTIKNKLQNRVLTAQINNDNNSENVIKAIKKISFIKSVYQYYPNIATYINNESYVMNYYDYDFNKINPTNLKFDEIIIPDSLSFKKNSIVKLKLNQKEYNFKVVSKYSSELVGCNDIIVSQVFMKQYYDNVDNKSLSIIINAYDHMNYTITALSKYGVDASMTDTSGVLTINIYKLAIKMIFIAEVIILVFVLYILVMLIGDIISDNNKDIAILKTCGFHNNKILLVIIKTLIKSTIKMFLIATSVCVFTYSILNLINVISFTFLKIQTFIFIILCSCIIFEFILIMSSALSFNKIKKISAIKLFKSE